LHLPAEGVCRHVCCPELQRERDYLAGARAEPDQRTGLRRLYVVLTRAVSELIVVHADELPVGLAG